MTEQNIIDQEDATEMDLDFPPMNPKELEKIFKEQDPQKEMLIQQIKAQEQAGDPAGLFQRAADEPEEKAHELEYYQTPHQPRTDVPAENYEDGADLVTDHQSSQSRPYNRVHLNHRYWIWAPDDLTDEVVQTKASQLHRELAARHNDWKFRTSEVTHTVMGESNDLTVRRITVMVAKEISGLNGKSLNSLFGRADGTLKKSAILNTMLQEAALGITEQIDFLMLTETWASASDITKWIKKDRILNQYYGIITDHNEDSNQYDRHGKGTAIVYAKCWQGYIQKVYKLEGRITCIQIRCKDKDILIGCFYLPSAPNKKENQPEMKKFSDKMEEILVKSDNSMHTIFGGDWNCALNPSIDRSAQGDSRPRQCSTKAEVKIMREIISDEQKHRLTDIWRLLNPSKREYTHSVYIGQDSPELIIQEKYQMLAYACPLSQSHIHSNTTL
ncbi:hypothetical protein MP228_001393 [Amoeboaphelidium protococcarum]|nr:hypothetical protein MP228_008597 [Amoeboaphelidium protococcarum]KAI3650315.1 hypothetical protein MP228_004829 [Amoeboaphelidium protococcarum]KAI3653446.1 hypothetical protein MP228_001393 [Amoeboaphelidium protococcarum]